VFLNKTLYPLLFFIIVTILFQSCDNANDNILSGTITYVDSISGIEEYANEAFVGLYKDQNLTQPIDSMYSDSEGEYLFYPVNYGSYYLFSAINLNGTLYNGIVSVNVNMNSTKTQNLVLKK
jgi:hypothetical protein